MWFPEAPSEVTIHLYEEQEASISKTDTTQTSIRFQAQIPAATQRQIIHNVLW